MIEKLFDTHSRVPVVYVMYGFNGDVLYVGKTTNIHTRWSAHNTSKHSVTNPEDVNAVVLYMMASEEDSTMYEAELIKEHTPIWNTHKHAVVHTEGTIKPVLVTTYDCLIHAKEEAKKNLLEERLDVMNRVKALMLAGLTKAEACSDVGITLSEHIRNYRYIKRYTN